MNDLNHLYTLPLGAAEERQRKALRRSVEDLTHKTGLTGLHASTLWWMTPRPEGSDVFYAQLKHAAHRLQQLETEHAD